MKTLATLLITLVLATVVSAQTATSTSTVAIGVSTAASFATSVSQCPTATVPNTAFICLVVPATGQPFLALSVAGYQAGAPFQATALPSTTTGVLSVNGKKPDATGNVSLSATTTTTVVAPTAASSTTIQ